MPLALALAIRTIVQLAVTMGVYTTAEAFIRAALPAMEKFLVRFFGFTEQEARNFLHDWMIDQALAFGLTVVALRKQMPSIVAERLGFTSKGFTKFGLSTIVKEKIKKTIGKEAPALLTSGWGTWTPVVKIMSVITSIWMLTQSFEVFAYRPTFFTNILSFFGLGKVAEKILIPPKKPLFSQREIESFAAALHITPDEMNLYLEAATDIVRSQAKLPTQANLLKVIREDLLGGAAAATEPELAAGTAVWTARAPFAGLISQAALAAAVPFVPRQDDLIENADELVAAAKANEASFLASLPGRILREIKVVSSVITKDGLTLRGGQQQIIVGHYKDGTPRYRTITNKFAVADFFLLSERGARTKISRIIYGPVNSGTFKPDATQLSEIDTALRANLAAAAPQIAQTITAPEAAAPATAITGEQIPAPATYPVPIAHIEITPRDYFVELDAFFQEIFYREGDRLVRSPHFEVLLTSTERQALPNNMAIVNEGIRRLEAAGIPIRSFRHKIFHTEINGRPAPITEAATFEDFFGSRAVIAPMTDATALPASALTATTLFAFYNAQNKPLPSVTQRGLIYEALGLGKTAYYTGTAEQNLKLLAKLQGKT